MNNNDILRRLRYILDFGDDKMMETFQQAGMEVNRALLSDWLKKEDDENHKIIQDPELATFLNGLIIHFRGKKDGELPIPESKLTNNAILRKLKIAFNLKDTDMLEIFKSVDLRISKHEISAFFRNPTQSQYRICHDQFLRNFIYGLKLKFRPN